MKLTPEEMTLCESVAFEMDVALKLKQEAKEALHQLQGWDAESEIAVPLQGLGASIDEHEAPAARERLQERLPEGYLAFWGDRNVLGQQTELGVLHTNDAFDIVRAKGTNAPNFELDTAAIVEQLTAWRKLCRFEIVGAAHDWVGITFDTLPADLAAFSEEIYDFCPDTIDQHFGCFPEAVDMMKEMGKAVPKQMSELMEGLDLSDPDKAGLQLLSRSLEQDRYLLLWWD